MPSPSRIRFGLMLARHRRKKGLTQADVARALGWSTAQLVSNFERSISFPPFDCLSNLAKMLGLRPRSLIREYFETKRSDLVQEERECLADLGA